MSKSPSNVTMRNSMSMLLASFWWKAKGSVRSPSCLTPISIGAPGKFLTCERFGKKNAHDGLWRGGWIVCKVFVKTLNNLFVMLFELFRCHRLPRCRKRLRLVDLLRRHVVFDLVATSRRFVVALRCCQT